MQVISNIVGYNLKNQKEIDILCKLFNNKKITEENFYKKLKKLLTE